jgi:YVTN family beta-propeller protein
MYNDKCHMNNHNNKGRCAVRARGFMALWGALIMAAAVSARPAAAAPFLYVTTGNGVSVIDTASNMVVATIPVDSAVGVAIPLDGKHAYVAAANGVAVIDTALNAVVATVPAPVWLTTGPNAIAVTPDGTRAYVASSPMNVCRDNGTVSVIDTARKTVVATITVGPSTVGPYGGADYTTGVAMAPDGQHAFVTAAGCNLDVAPTVGWLDTATNTAVTTVPRDAAGVPPNGPVGVAITPDGRHAYVAIVGIASMVTVVDTAGRMVAFIPFPPTLGSNPFGVAITPDGKHAYVALSYVGTVLVIDTASNMVVATVPVGNSPFGVAITPDGKHAYVANGNGVSVIDTATNVVVATVPVGPARAIAIIPDIPFSAFSAKLAIHQGAFQLESGFTLGSSSNGINPPAEPVTLQIGTFGTTIPPGSFTATPGAFGMFTFAGVINGATLQVLIYPTGTKRYALVAAAQNANLTGTVNPATVRVSIGVDSGTAPVTALVTLVADVRSKAGPSAH